MRQLSCLCSNNAGYRANVIRAGRKVNEYIPHYISEMVKQNLAELNIPIKKARVGIFGLTYKENCPDIHDTKIIDTINDLNQYGANVLVFDPIADPKISKQTFNIDLKKWNELKNLHVLVIMVAHKQFQEMDTKKILGILNKKAVIMDIKGIIEPKKYQRSGVKIWQL